ncbi:hypothetical protein [Paraburkholderia aromaticivorans]|uniref:hypothetical protein n=1 Tax=Paraburkholderia aromaticivorans TaxID=2026199 RepID=UPI0012FD6A5F|nr:hypothetical protein [Paraburkholderia aromaticivorans]
MAGSVATLRALPDRNFCRTNLRLRHYAQAQVCDKDDKKQHVRKKVYAMQIALSPAQQIERNVNPQSRGVGISTR